MSLIKKTVKLEDKEKYLKLHFSIINPMFPVQLSNKEAEILSAFLSLDNKLIEDEVFNPLTRKKVMEVKKLSAGALGNHLKSMLSKGFLSKDAVTNRITINKACLPCYPEQSYNFKLILNENKES